MSLLFLEWEIVREGLIWLLILVFLSNFTEEGTNSLAKRPQHEISFQHQLMRNMKPFMIDDFLIV